MDATHRRMRSSASAASHRPQSRYGQTEGQKLSPSALRAHHPHHPQPVLIVGLNKTPPVLAPSAQLIGPIDIHSRAAAHSAHRSSSSSQHRLRQILTRSSSASLSLTKTSTVDRSQTGLTQAITPTTMAPIPPVSRLDSQQAALEHASSQRNHPVTSLNQDQQLNQSPVAADSASLDRRTSQEVAVEPRTRPTSWLGNWSFYQEENLKGTKLEPQATSPTQHLTPADNQPATSQKLFSSEQTQASRLQPSPLPVESSPSSSWFGTNTLKLLSTASTSHELQTPQSSLKNDHGINRSASSLKSDNADKGKARATEADLGSQTSQTSSELGQQKPAMTKSSQSSLPSGTSGSWWSWRSVEPIDPSHSESDLPSSSALGSDNIDVIEPAQTGVQVDSSDTNKLGQWAYSWYAGSSAYNSDSSRVVEPTQLVETILPNPIIESIPENIRGWAGYFSSKKLVPSMARKVTEDERKSVESMQIDLSSLESDGSSSRLKTGDRNLLDEAANKRTEPSQAKLAVAASTESSPVNERDHKKTKITAPLTDTVIGATPAGNQGGKVKGAIPNLVLPTFEDTFLHPPRSFLPKPSKFKQTLDLVGAYIFSASPDFPQTVKGERQGKKKVIDLFERNHHISTRLPKSLRLMGINGHERMRKVNRITVIGIHGWFPGWLEYVTGKPTGTSTKFATMMTDSLKRYFSRELSEELNPNTITVIPLEGEGKVDQRVDLLYAKLCQRHEWIESLRKSQAIFVVSHSQGSLVSCKLIERLIKSEGIRGDRVLALCMCGIWNGPSVGLNSNYALQPVLKLEGPAAQELFEFQSHSSKASQAVMASMNTCLSAGTKFLLIASLNDQVVPIYSALNTSIDHPLLLRSVFVDSAVFYSMDFLTNLIVFCQRLKNSGLSDHGLQNHLSEALVGSLNGIGHSTAYEQKDVFDLGVRYFFETTTAFERPTNLPEFSTVATPSTVTTKPSVDHHLKHKTSLSEIDHSFNPRDKRNDYLIPWSLRGLIEDRQIKLLFSNELDELRDEFEEWKPTTKVLKDVKLRLEPLKIDSIRNKSMNHIDI